MKDTADLLNEHPFCKGLDQDIISLIAGCAKNVAFKENEYILNEGKDADSFYLIRHGTVALEMFLPSRGPFTFLTIKGGEILGASWLIPPYRWNYDARAVELTRAIAFDCTCLRKKCEEDHHVGYQLMKRFLPPLIERLTAARLQSTDLYGSKK